MTTPVLACRLHILRSREPILVALSLVALLSCASKREAVPRARFRLVAPPSCQSFRGESKGNDPMNVQLYLCKNGTALNGEILLSGAQSGFSVRAIVGSIAPDGSLALKETHSVEEGRAAGWKFCSDTQYSLTPGTDGFVRGTYRSNECDDSATVFLIPDDVPPPAPTSTAPSPPASSSGVSP